MVPTDNHLVGVVHFLEVLEKFDEILLSAMAGEVAGMNK